jgi:hypothetical protein
MLMKGHSRDHQERILCTLAHLFISIYIVRLSVITEIMNILLHNIV